MKKIIIILSLVAIGLTSCKKEVIEPQCFSQCGTIEFIYIDGRIKVKNNCSGKTKQFYVSGYEGGDIGKQYCATESW